MTALRNRMEFLETESELTETLSTAIAEWLSSGDVRVTKYPHKYHNAINTQHSIGWRHFFTGKISQEWSKLHKDSSKTIDENKREIYIQGASIVELTLKHFIELWELRNEEVHRKTEQQQEKIRKQKLCTELRRLNIMSNTSQPSDVCLFHDDIEAHFGQSSAQTIAIFISSHQRAILNSVRKFAKASITGATTILDWLRGNENDETIAHIHTRQRASQSMKLKIE
jgi:hypothetical protein